VATTYFFLLKVISRLLYPHFLLLKGTIQQHSLREPTASRIIVTEAGSASGAGIKASIIVHGKNDIANDA